MKNKIEKILTLRMKSIEALELLEYYNSTKVVLMCKIEFPELMMLGFFVKLL